MVGVNADFDFELDQGEVGKVIHGYLYDATHSLVDLSTADEIVFFMGKSGCDDKVVDGETAVALPDQTANRGEATYTFSVAGAGSVGVFEAQWRVTWGATVEFFPTDPLRVRVRRSSAG